MINPDTNVRVDYYQPLKDSGKYFWKLLPQGEKPYTYYIPEGAWNKLTGFSLEENGCRFYENEDGAIDDLARAFKT